MQGLATHVRQTSSSSMLITVLVAALAAVSATQNVTQQNITVQKDPGLLSEPLTFGPTPELVHLYYDLWPTGKY